VELDEQDRSDALTNDWRYIGFHDAYGGLCFRHLQGFVEEVHQCKARRPPKSKRCRIARTKTVLQRYLEPDELARLVQMARTHSDDDVDQSWSVTRIVLEWIFNEPIH
jgi:hypothetical protein